MTRIEQVGPRTMAPHLGSKATSFLLVAVGGALGAATRVAAVAMASAWGWPSLVWLLSVNLLGTFILGAALGRFGGSMRDAGPGGEELPLERPRRQLAGVFLATGFCGGMTTYSGLALELVSLWQAGSQATAAGLLFVGLGSGIAVISLGVCLFRCPR